MDSMDMLGETDTDKSVPRRSGAVPAGPSYFRFSTRGIPPEGRFETWRDLWMRRLVEVDITTDEPESFNGEVELWTAGPISVARFDVARAEYERTASHANNGDNDFSLTLYNDPAGYCFTHKQGKLPLKPGGAFFLSHDRRYKVSPTARRYSFSLLHMKRDALLELTARRAEPSFQSFGPGNSVLKLIRNTVPLITNKTEPTTHTRRAEIGQQLIDLVALMLSPSRDGRYWIERRGLKAARIGAVLEMIDRRHAEPDLSADTVARELGICVRQVHRLLEETTKTFYEHVLERRLARAHELLSDRFGGRRRVADIAFAAGFTSVGYFNEAFRRRFGDTPTGIRSAGA